MMTAEIRPPGCAGDAFGTEPAEGITTYLSRGSDDDAFGVLSAFGLTQRSERSLLSRRRDRKAVDLDASPVVVTDERVGRGADYLDRRWADDGPRIKQLAIATRGAGLTLPQFQDL
jgi:hypothetical protein